jgi:hypothetical protein
MRVAGSAPTQPDRWTGCPDDADAGSRSASPPRTGLAHIGDSSLLGRTDVAGVAPSRRFGRRRSRYNRGNGVCGECRRRRSSRRYDHSRYWSTEGAQAAEVAEAAPRHSTSYGEPAFPAEPQRNAECHNLSSSDSNPENGRRT